MYVVVLGVKTEEGADFYIRINDRGQESPENTTGFGALDEGLISS